MKTMSRVIVAALVLGTLLNLVGWIGNALVLRELWASAAAAAPAPAIAFEPRWLKEALTLVSDYAFALVLCALYSIALPAWTKSRVSLAIALAALVWLAAVPMTYLAFVITGYLPLDVSVTTSAWALGAFLLSAPALPFLLRSPEVQARPR
jgi:hypothetical protein